MERRGRKPTRKNEDEITPVILLALASIIATFVFSYFAYAVTKNEFPQSLAGLWDRWDTPHYLEIAKNGYLPDGEGALFIVFLPAYPLLVRAVFELVREYLASALLVSNIAFVIAVVFFYKLVRLDYGRQDAYRAVKYLSIFPTAYFLHAGYTESVYLATAIASFYYARKSNWKFAGASGMLAALTRMTGVVLLFALPLEYVRRKAGKGGADNKVGWLFLVALGLGAYLAINYAVFQDPLKFMQVQQEHWSKKLALPTDGALGALNSLSWRSPNEKLMVGVSELFFAAIGLVLGIHALLWVRKSYGIYCLATWLAVTSTSYWMSIPRYTISMFPIFVSLSLLGRNRIADYTITLSSILLQALFLTLFAWGWWAF